MCIVIDTNCIGNVFNITAQNHQTFIPVFNWIMFGRGKVVYGGSKYKAEIAGKYLNLILQLRKAGKAIPINDADVDAAEIIVARQIVHRDFDDPHLVGLLQISACRLICSLDESAFPFFQHVLFFPHQRTRPRIYSRLRNRNLLNDNNIAPVCLPCSVLTAVQRKAIGYI